MATTRKRSAGRPAKGDIRLNADAVLDAALILLDAGGDAAVTFRALARALDVTPMAVSHHVGSRNEMFIALVAKVYAGVGEVPVSGTAGERVRSMLKRYMQRACAHPNLVQCVFADPGLMSGELIRLTETVREYLAASGVPEQHRETLLGVVVDYTHGFSASSAAYAAREPRNPGAAPGQTIDDYLRGLDWILGRITASATDD